MTAESPGFLWDTAKQDILEIALPVWGVPRHSGTQRQAAANSFAMRVLRRMMAFDSLFPSGLYLEAYPLVRTAYEDWLSLAFILQAPDASRWDEFQSDVWKHDARVHDAFARLCGDDAAKHWFGKVPPEAAPHVGKLRRETMPRLGRSWQYLADAVGLGLLHQYIYTVLSDPAHGATTKGEALLFDEKAARIPERSPEQETRLALWVWWFHLRVVTLAAKEYGVDVEDHSDEVVSLFSQSAGYESLEGCVLRRESLGSR